MKKKEPNVENRQVAILKDGANSPFWRTLKDILENEKKDINSSILNKEEGGLTDKQVDDLIRWYNFLDYVVLLPEKCIESLEKVAPDDGSRSNNQNKDPYEQMPLSEVRDKITDGTRA